jgi:hypothetical protein
VLLNILFPAEEKMKMRKLVFVLSLVLLAGTSWWAVQAAEKSTWSGTLVDAYCYLQDNSNVGNDHSGVKGCGTDCLKNGRPAGLLTDDKKFFTIVAPAPALAKYVGQAIRVTGELYSGAIVADKLEVKQAGKWVAVDINIKGMM